MKRIGLVVGVVALCVAGALWWTRERAPRARDGGVPATRPNVLLITIDTLRADRLGRGFTPTLDRLAAEGTRFVNARTAVPLTLPAHVTIMTGTVPPVHGVHDNGLAFEPGPPTLARVLHDAGYRTGAFVGAYVLNHIFGLADGFDRYDDRVHRDPALGAQLEAERRGGEVVDAALEWIGSSPAQPFFMWVHLYDPHAPYDPPAEFRTKAGEHPYDGEVAYADAQIGRLLSTLGARGLLDGTLVAVTGDHGEGLGDHGEQAHGMLAYDSTLRVPLVLRGPSVGRGIVSDRNVSLAGLAGTILRSVALDAPKGMSDGVHLLLSDGAEVYAETEYPRAAGWHALTTLVADRWKLILSSEPELYDVTTDPAEQHNVVAERGPTVEAMTKRVRELAASDAPRAASSVPAEAAERLRALGYVSGSASVAADDDRAPNPARNIEAWTAFERALADVSSGRAPAALPALKILAARFPDGRVFQATYARALKDTGDAPAAVAVYRQAIARWPGDASLYHDLAVAARAAGDAREALRAEQAALALDAGSPTAMNGLGLLQAEAGDTPAAARSFEKATTADPSNASFWVNLGNARRDLGDLDSAEQAYRRALEIDATYADAANGLGVVFVQRKRPADAIPLFQQAVRRDPRLYEAQLNLGIAYHESGDRAKAAEAYRRLLATAPASAARERKAAAELLRSVQ
jgi:choline-sulfatase